MNDLLDNVYLPDLKKRSIRESDAYKLLKDNNKDTSVLEGYDNHPDAGTVNFESFDKFLGEGGTKEEWIARHATPEVQKEFFSNVGDFMLETGKDTVLSLATAVVNGADVATNLMPLFVKALDSSPLFGNQNSFVSDRTEEQVYNFANKVSNNLGEAREYLNEFKKDDNFASQLIGVMSQDLLYSVPIYNKLRSAGFQKYPAFFISGAIGGAIGIEDKIMGAESTFSQEFFSKDIIELKNLIGILPNTPEDKIADEVVQALEYGAFSIAIPGIIDAFIFMKKYVPAMTATTGATIGMTADNEAEGSPIKSILKAVDSAPMFKSAVVDAADNIPTVASGDQIFNTIKNTSGVKESELKWMDLEGFLKGKNKVSKDEVLEYINTNKIDVTEVKLSKDGNSGLPKYLRQNVDEYETRWRDSDLADGVTPNYDRYRIEYKDYSRGSGVEAIMPDIKSDWSSTVRNPLIEAMDSDVEIIGTGTKWNTINALLEPWKDMQTGKFTGHVIELDGDDLRKFPKDSYNYVSAGAMDENNKFAERYIVSSNSLEEIDLKYKYKKIATYEMDNIEFERFHLEDEIRSYNKFESEKTNQPLFEKYTVAGGDDYTELVFKIKNKEGTTPAVLEGEFGTLANNKVKTETKTAIDYRNPNHFNQSNEFAHVRFKTRTLDNGKKVLAVEEMQSDLLQASKTDMFSSANSNMRKWNDRDGVAYADKVLKDFPFKNNWYEFTIKRLTRYAADNGFDAIAIPKGSLAANRYGQKINKITSVEAVPSVGKTVDEDAYIIRIMDENNEAFKEIKVSAGGPGELSLDQVFEQMSSLRKDIGDKNYSILQQTYLEAVDTKQLVNNKIETSVTGTGKGKFELYDKTIPGYMKKYAKKWNAKVYDDSFLIKPIIGQNTDMPVTILELSDEMKTGVQSSSQPLFELFGGVSLSTWGAKAVSDSMKNNTISQTTN
jgi:hypothetical protein